MDLLTFQQMTILQPPLLGPEHITHIPASSDYYPTVFFPKTFRLWNTLLTTFAKAPGLVPFKRELSGLMIQYCIGRVSVSMSW